MNTIRPYSPEHAAYMVLEALSKAGGLADAEDVAAFKTYLLRDIQSRTPLQAEVDAIAALIAFAEAEFKDA